MKKFISTLMIVSLMAASFVTFKTATYAQTPYDFPDMLEEYGLLTEVAIFSYGYGEDQIGYVPAGYETLDSGPTSFYVLNDTFYLLDNVNKKVLIKKNSDTHTIYYKDACWLKDIYVSPEEEIFVLDSCKNIVAEFDVKGNLIKEIPVPESIAIPYELGMNSHHELYVREAGGYSVTVARNQKVLGKSFSNTNREIFPSIINDQKGSLNIGSDIHIDIPYNYSFGELKIHGLTEDKIIISKTEVAPNIPFVVAESFIQMIDFAGGILGAIRIPTEKMIFIPDQMVRTDNGSIYLFSVEKDYAKIYKVYLGKKYESKMEESIEAKMSSYLSIDMNTGDELQLTGDTGPNGPLHRATVSSRASSMISHSWTIKSGNLTAEANTTIPSYLSGKKVGDQVTAIPYKWGGADGANEGAGGRSSFSTYQNQGKQTGDVNTNKPGGLSSVTGLDCSGFVGLAWFRTDKKYSTSTLSEITNSITKSDLKLMDALNSSGFHTVLYVSSTTDGISTKESTTDNGGRSQNYTRTWTWLQNKGFTYIRYRLIVDDGLPLPQPYKN